MIRRTKTAAHGLMILLALVRLLIDGGALRWMLVPEPISAWGDCATCLAKARQPKRITTSLAASMARLVVLSTVLALLLIGTTLAWSVITWPSVYDPLEHAQRCLR